MMNLHPVRLRVERPLRMARVHVVVRLLVAAVLATVGWSSVHWVLYLAVPVLVALLLSSQGTERYLSQDAPRMVRVLRWLAGAYAYLWLLTDEFPPPAGGHGAVELEIEMTGAPTPSSALARLVTSFPAFLLFALLTIVACILWPVGALVILMSGRLPAGIADFLALTVRYQFRLFAYHLSLVDRYPAVEDASAMRDVSHSGAA